MKSNARTILQVIAALAFAFMLVGFGAHHAGAAEMDKGAFKQGCQEGGNSYVENNDGSFQCNLKDGGTIKCKDTKSQCTYNAKLATDSGSGGGRPTVAGAAGNVFKAGTFDAGAGGSTSGTSTTMKATRVTTSGILESRDQ